MHRCPVDKRLLRSKPMGDGRDTFRCTECEGVWLPGATVTDAIGRLPRSTLRTLKPTPHLVCPLDNGALRVLVHRQIEIDVCDHCGGAWLDAGELQTLRQRGQHWLVRECTELAVAAPHESVALLAGRVTQGLDEAIEFVGDALTAIW